MRIAIKQERSFSSLKKQAVQEVHLDTAVKRSKKECRKKQCENHSAGTACHRKKQRALQGKRKKRNSNEGEP